MDLLTFINIAEPHGASITHLQSHMLKSYGLKFRTTSEMVQELTVSGSIKVDGHGFYHITDRQKEAFKTTIAHEKAENLVDPLTKRIDKIKDDTARRKILAVATRLEKLLAEIEENEASGESAA
jgi:Mn-dependent DtxR family transcriptional regulator